MGVVEVCLIWILDLYMQGFKRPQYIYIMYNTIQTQEHQFDILGRVKYVRYYRTDVRQDFDLNF